jgi:hypothetical protein
MKAITRVTEAITHVMEAITHVTESVTHVTDFIFMPDGVRFGGTDFIWRRTGVYFT